MYVSSFVKHFQSNSRWQKPIRSRTSFLEYFYWTVKKLCNRQMRNSDRNKSLSWLILSRNQLYWKMLRMIMEVLPCLLNALFTPMMFLQASRYTIKRLNCCWMFFVIYKKLMPMWYLTLSGKPYKGLAAISSKAIKCSRYSFLYEMSPSTAVHFFISAVRVWNVMFDVMMVFIPLKHSMLTSHSFAFYRMIKISFTNKSTISSDCTL